MTRIWEIKLMDRIEEIRAREQAATKGPWRVWGNAVDNWTDSRAMSFRVFAEVCTFWKSPGDDLQFIAKSREDIPFLLARVAELERELAEINDAARACAGETCGDEKHCTCVPLLRKQLAEAKAEIAKLKRPKEVYTPDLYESDFQ